MAGKRGRPKRVAATKAEKARDDADSGAALRNSPDDAVWAKLAAELTAFDARIAKMKEGRSALMLKYKEEFGLKIGAFNQAYRDSQREGADKSTHVASYFQYARALGVMADLPLAAAAIDKVVAKAGKIAEKEAAEKAEAQAEAHEPPADDDGDESASLH